MSIDEQGKLNDPMGFNAESSKSLDARIDAWAKGPGREFAAYDPVLTFSSPCNDRFIRVGGKPGNKLNPDSAALFDLGREAFARLAQGETLDKANFEEGYAFYWSFLDDCRALVSQAQSKGRLIFIGRTGSENQESADVNLLDDSVIISIAWKIQSRLDEPARSDGSMVRAFFYCFLFHVLREIDNCMIGEFLDGRDAVVAAIEAANALSNAISIESGNEKEQEIRRDIAYRGAMEKLKRDPKQVAKAQVKECWMAWQKKPDSYKNKSAFAKGMMEKYEELDSQVVITRWCSQWEKEASN